MYRQVPIFLATVVCTISTSIASSNSQSLQQQILGRWESEFDGQKTLVIFAPNNQLFVVSLRKFNDGKFYPLVPLEFKYKLDTTVKPAHLDVSLSSLSGNPADKLYTILEIGKNNKLKVQLAGVFSNRERPTNFAGEVSIFRKVSKLTSLPPAPSRALIESMNREVEAKANVSSINRSQTAYRAEKGTFASSFDYLELARVNLIGKSRAQTSNYTYQLLSTENRAYITATARIEGTKSYVGATFRYLNPDRASVMRSIICETEKPTTIAPMYPTWVGGKDLIKCPAGSQELD